MTRGKAKRADYILYYKPNIPIAIIEAKDNNHSIGDGMQQALDYAVTLNIPFVFSSNGDGFVFHDRTGTSMEQEATLSLDVAPGPWEFRLDNYYTEFNNPLNRPSYWHSNAFISRSFNHGRTMLTLGGTNIFNQAVQYFGYLGLGTTALANQYNLGTVTPQEEFGLAPAQHTLTLTQKY